MKEFFHEFVKSTSLNGIYLIYSSKSLIRRIFWICLFVTVCVGLVYHISMLLIRYLGFEIQTTSRMDILQTLPFPSVTVCNLSPVDKSKLADSQFIQALLLLENGTIDDENEEIKKDLRSKDCSCVEASNNDSIACPLSECYSEMIKKFLNASRTSDFSDFRDRMQLEWNDYETGAHELEDFIVSCTYDHKDCGDMGVDSYYSGRYGRCYTYANLNDSRLNSTEPGEKGGGLKLVLNINSENYIGLLSPETGIKIVITDPDLQPLPDVDGILASPGFTTMIGLKRKETIRLSAPYKTDCMAKYPDNLVPILAEATNKYSDFLCHKACLDLYTNVTCGCFESLDTPEAAGVTCAPLFNSEQWECISTLFDLDNSSAYDDFQKSHCGCKVACNEMRFTKMIAQAPWPSKSHQALLSRMSKSEKLKFLMKTKSMEYLRENLVNIHVFYETFNVDIVEESADYSLTSLFSDVGGITGLYLGMSLVTLFELLECFCATMKTYLLRRFVLWKKEFPSNASRLHLEEIDSRARSASLINLVLLSTNRW